MKRPLAQTIHVAHSSLHIYASLGKRWRRSEHELTEHKNEEQEKEKGLCGLRESKRTKPGNVYG